jgi:hypothetical protein
MLELYCRIAQYCADLVSSIGFPHRPSYSVMVTEFRTARVNCNLVLFCCAQDKSVLVFDAQTEGVCS